MKKESKETLKDEMEETPKVQDKEASNGTEEVPIPEEFQRQVGGMIKEHGHSKARLQHIRGAVSTAEDALREKEMAAKSNDIKGKSSVPSEYSTADAPSM